jgi:hypothetical protein
MKLDEVYIPFGAREFRSEHAAWYKKLARTLDMGIMNSSHGTNRRTPYREENGCWFGGTLVFHNGVADEEKRREGICLTFEKRVMLWLKEVAKVLDAKVADGHKVYINTEPTWSTNSIRAVRPGDNPSTDTLTEMRVMAKIKDPCVNHRFDYPRICWWVSDEAE